MNPLTNTRNITKLSGLELRSGGGGKSWHDEYRDSAWVFSGGLPYDLTEGDVLAVFSQYGEIVNVNLVRDKVTGKSKGFVFVCYEDQRSTILAVDNLNAIKLNGRTIRVDHVKDYKPPKDSDKYDDVTRQLMTQGCAPGSSFAHPDQEAQQDDDEFLLPLSSSSRVTNEKDEDRGRDVDTKDKSSKLKKSREDHKKKSKKSKGKKRKSRREGRSHKKKKSQSRSSRSDSDSESDEESSSSSDSSSNSKSRKRKR